MRRSTLIVAFILAGAALSSASAQMGGSNGRLGRQGNRLNRFAGYGGYGAQTGSTMFDLYRSRRIPVPPYFSLHPPVYYNGIDYQRYGTTPFAYPYTWWQQYGYGHNGGPPPISGHGPTAAFDGYDVGPVTVENPHCADSTEETVKSTTLNSQARVIRNPFVKSNGLSLKEFDSSVALFTNPYVDDPEKSEVKLAKVEQGK